MAVESESKWLSRLKLKETSAAAPAFDVYGPRWYPRCKSALDFAAALWLFVAVAPLLALCILFVKLTSRGPAFYWQTRLGRGGRPFTIYKIRTMIHDCESLSGPRWATPQDPRVTLVGRVLRKTHLDELPQLWNVLRGEMSLIGPRPERPEFVPQLECVIPLYRSRLLVRPGLSGLAQVQLPADTDLESVRLKLAHDLYYVQHSSFGLDVRLMFATACYLLRLPFEWTQRFVHVPTGAAITQGYAQLLKQQIPMPRSSVPVRVENSYRSRMNGNGRAGHASAPSEKAAGTSAGTLAPNVPQVSTASSGECAHS
jgi:lipopolysaccharide/colanic/teichoic acid biosynthesis glycosyltransferase